MKTENLSELIKTTKKMLLTGGRIIREGAARTNRVSYKSATSPVTEVDQAAERAVFGIVRKRFPDHTFLGEESDFLKQGDRGPSRPGRYRWIVDPLDGTVNFIHRIPQSCISVGVECNGVVMAGGVYDPFRDELFLAARGCGATMNGQKIRVSQRKNISNILAVTGFPYNRGKVADSLLPLVGAFLRKGIDLRRFGAAALDLSWIACGRVDVYWEVGLKPWDIAAGLLLVEEAGGKTTDFAGDKINLDKPKQLMSSNGFLHPAVVRLFKNTTKRP